MKLRIILGLILLASAAFSEDRIRLSNDKPYAAKLQQVLATKPDGSDLAKLHHWLWDYAGAQSKCRNYYDAEIAARAALALYPQFAPNHSNLSVFLGKQGKYEEALREADIAALLNPADTMHADAVAASWLFYLGRKDEAIKRFAAIPIPTDPHQLRAYLGCKACLSASLGDVDVLKQAIKQTLDMDPESRAFFERDMVFDKYRKETWFMELVGVTTEPDQG